MILILTGINVVPPSPENLPLLKICLHFLFTYLGMNSPFIDIGMSKNINFVAEVSSHFRKDDEIIVVSAYPP